MKFWHTHKWKTAAIDTSNGFHTINSRTGKPDKASSHIIKFQYCSCGDRQIVADDPTEQGRIFALNRNDAVALQRAIWEESGKITGFVVADITWIDPVYAPLGGFEEYIKAMKSDQGLTTLLKEHPMVDDALEQFEVAIKLCINNSQVTS
jgi:hypothetical protein